MDTDLDSMSREQLIAEVKKLRMGIRGHRDSTGHELCWHHPALWALLPERSDPVPVVPEWPQFMAGCIRYRQSLDKQVPNAPRTTRPYDKDNASPPKADARIRIREIDHLVLRVADLDKVLHFYCEALGCVVERRQEEIGLIQLRAGRSLIDLVPVDGKLGRAGGAAPGAEGRNVDHFCLRVEPFDAAAIRSRLVEYGYAPGPVEKRYGAEGEGPSLYITDPEGNVVELKGPPGG